MGKAGQTMTGRVTKASPGGLPPSSQGSSERTGRGLWAISLRVIHPSGGQAWGSAAAAPGVRPRPPLHSRQATHRAAGEKQLGQVVSRARCRAQPGSGHSASCRKRLPNSSTVWVQTHLSKAACQKHRLHVQSWVQILSLSFTSCETLGKLLAHSEPPSSHVQNEKK